MKYLTRQTDLGIELVAFTGTISHDAMAAKLGWRSESIRSAGFISLTATGLYCHGDSSSLGLGSRVEDSKLATAYFKQ